MGPWGICPRCGSLSCEWNPQTDRCTCPTCGYGTGINKNTEKPHFTAEEVADAKEIVRIFGREDVVRRITGRILCFGHIAINPCLLPSLNVDCEVDITEITKDGEA